MATFCVAQSNLLGSGGCEDLFNISQVKVNVNELIQINFLVLPSCMQLLSFSKYTFNFLPHLFNSSVFLSNHVFTKSNYFTKCFLSCLNLCLQIIMLSFQHLSRSSIRNFLL